MSLRTPSRSRSRSRSSGNKTTMNLPYTPVFQPPGYPYKIALPHAPKPGETPWPMHLPPMVSHSPSRLERSRTLPSSHYRDDAMPAYASVPASSIAPTSQRSSTLNPLIAHQPDRAPSLSYNITQPPTSTQLSSSPAATLTPWHRSPPALYPPASRMLIKSDLVNWTIEVFPSQRTGVITCGDVLEAINESKKYRIATSYKARCARAGGWERWEEQCGIRRVDCLLDSVIFSGLVPSPDGASFLLKLGSQ